MNMHGRPGVLVIERRPVKLKRLFPTADNVSKRTDFVHFFFDSDTFFSSRALWGQTTHCKSGFVSRLHLTLDCDTNQRRGPHPPELTYNEIRAKFCGRALTIQNPNSQSDYLLYNPRPFFSLSKAAQALQDDFFTDWASCKFLSWQRKFF